MKTMTQSIRPSLFVALLTRVVLILCALDSTVQAQDAAPSSVTVFENVRIFDGKSGEGRIRGCAVPWPGRNFDAVQGTGCRNRR